MKRLLVGAVLALSLAANGAVLVMSVRAQAASPAGIPLFSRVAVDAAQREQVLKLRKGFHAFRAENYARTDALRAQLAELLKTDAPDRARIDAVLAQISESQAALQRRVVEQAISVRALLRPEQRPAFEELMTQQLTAGVPVQRNGANNEDCPLGSGR